MEPAVSLLRKLWDDGAVGRLREKIKSEVVGLLREGRCDRSDSIV